MPNIENKLFMSYAKTCGHDKRGMKTKTDDIRLIPQHLKKLKAKVFGKDTTITF